MGTPFLDQRARSRKIALSEVPLLARHRELTKLVNFVRARTPALIFGGGGLGKTRLLLELQRALAAESKEAIVLRFRQPLHEFLLDIAAQLSVTPSNPSSIALRGAIWKSFEERPRVVLLDDIADPASSVYRFFERIIAIPGNTMIGTAAHLYATGSLQRVFWNQQQSISLQPFGKRDAESLIEIAVEMFLPGQVLPPDFRERILQAARGNPGRIVDMCIRAGDPYYRSDRDHIRFGALLMDSVTGLLS